MFNSTPTIRSAFIEVCQILAEQENLQVIINGVGKGALVVGVGAAVCGLLGGPRGFAIGGALASIMMGVHGSGCYRSVVDILRNDLTSTQLRMLATAVRRVLNNIEIEDVATLLVLLANLSLKESVIKEIGKFLLQELSLKMIR